jgi:hypothetical protein
LQHFKSNLYTLKHKIEFFLNELIKSYNNIKKDDLKLDLKNLKLIENQKSHDNLKIFIETYNNEIEKIKNAKIVDSQGKEITEKRIKELIQPAQQTAAPEDLKEILKLIKPYLPFITNKQIETGYENAKSYEELIETVKKIIISIFDEEIKEEDKIKQVKALVLTIESLNKLYRAFFENLDSFNIEKLENNKCIISNEIAKIMIFNKMHKTLNKNPLTKKVAENLDNTLKISEKHGKIDTLLKACKAMIIKKNEDYEFLDLNFKFFSDDSKIEELLKSIKDENNELSEIINKIISFSEELISITGLLNNIVLPSELKI